MYFVPFFAFAFHVNMKYSVDRQRNLSKAALQMLTRGLFVSFTATARAEMKSQKTSSAANQRSVD